MRVRRSACGTAPRARAPAPLCANVSETPGPSGISVVEGEVDEDRDVDFYQAKWICSRGTPKAPPPAAAKEVREASPPAPPSEVVERARARGLSRRVHTAHPGHLPHAPRQAGAGAAATSSRTSPCQVHLNS